MRLTPLLAVNILILVSVFRYVASGPRWPFMVDMLSGQCEVNWWKTLLYVQNYVNPENIVCTCCKILPFSIFQALHETVVFHSDRINPTFVLFPYLVLWTLLVFGC